MEGAGGTPRPAIRLTLRCYFDSLFDSPRDFGPPSHGTRASDARFARICDRIVCAKRG